MHISSWVVKGGMYTDEMCILRPRGERYTDGTSKAPQRAVTSRSKPLDETIRAAMKKSERDLQRDLGKSYRLEEADFLDRVTICGHEFATYRTSESHGVIFFQVAVGSNSLAP